MLKFDHDRLPQCAIVNLVDSYKSLNFGHILIPGAIRKVIRRNHLAAQRDQFFKRFSQIANHLDLPPECADFDTRDRLRRLFLDTGEEASAGQHRKRRQGCYGN